MSKPTIPVDKTLLQAAIDKAEANGPLTNQNALWQKTAELYNANPGAKPITFSVVYLRFNQFDLTCKTPKGKKGRTSMSQEQKDSMQAGRVAKGPRSSKVKKLAGTDDYRKHIERLREATPERFRPLIDRIEKGSKSAASKLMCIQCMGFRTSDIHACQGFSCPMFLFRPYQRDGQAEQDEQVDITASLQDDVEETNDAEDAAEEVVDVTE